MLTHLDAGAGLLSWIFATGQESTVTPYLSVIVPVFGNAALLECCLAGIRQSSCQDLEILVADDASPNAAAIAEVAGLHRAHVVRLNENRGPAAARNRAAKAASGEVLVFLDSDVTVHTDTLARIAEAFRRDPKLAALMGSYDLDPDVHGTVATFRNLLHAHVHHRSSRQATTFWAGCGGVRRPRFLELGGFDESYPQPSIEDVEFGMRLHRADGKLALDPEIQVTHRKRWTIGSMFYADTFLRAMPWTGLMLDRGLPSDLNFRWQDRLSLLLAALLPVLAFLAARFGQWWWGVTIAAVTAIGLLQWPLYRFLTRARSLRFSIASFPLYLVHCWSAAIGFVLGFFRWETIRDRRFPAAAAVLALLIFGVVRWGGGAYRADFNSAPGDSALWPPLYHLVDRVLWLFMPSSWDSAVLLQGLVGWIAALCLYRMARFIAPPLAALAASCVLVAAPVFRGSVTHPAPELLALCFGLLEMQAVVRFLRRQDQRAFAEAGVWCALGLLTHGMAVATIPAPVIALLPDGRWRTVRVRYWIWFFAWIGAALLWYASPHGGPLPWMGTTPVLPWRLDMLSAVAGAGIVAVAVCGMLTLLREYQPTIAVAGSVFCSLAVCSAAIRTMREPRHLMLAIPAVLLLALACARSLWTRLPARAARRSAAAACAIVALALFS